MNRVIQFFNISLINHPSSNSGYSSHKHETKHPLKLHLAAIQAHIRIQNKKQGKKNPNLSQKSPTIHVRAFIRPHQSPIHCYFGKKAPLRNLITYAYGGRLKFYSCIIRISGTKVGFSFIPSENISSTFVIY